MAGNNPTIEVLSGPERRRRWTTAEKLAMVEETYAPDVTVSLVARRNGVQPNQLLHWRKLAAQGALTATAAEGEVVAAAEYRALQNRVRELQHLLGKKTMEAEILKDAQRTCELPCLPWIDAGIVDMSCRESIHENATASAGRLEDDDNGGVECFYPFHDAGFGVLDPRNCPSGILANVDEGAGKIAADDDLWHGERLLSMSCGFLRPKQLFRLMTRRRGPLLPNGVVPRGAGSPPQGHSATSQSDRGGQHSGSPYVRASIAAAGAFVLLHFVSNAFYWVSLARAEYVYRCELAREAAREGEELINPSTMIDYDAGAFFLFDDRANETNRDPNRLQGIARHFGVPSVRFADDEAIN